VSTTTPKLGLTKSAGTEPQDIDILNANFDLLDTAAGNGNDAYNGKNAAPYWIASNNTGTSVPNGAETVVKNWDTAIAGHGTNDVGNVSFSYNAATGELTVKKAGLYDVVANVSFPSNSTGLRTLRINVNGALVKESAMDATASIHRPPPTAYPVFLLANDKVTISANQTSGGALVAGGDGSSRNIFAVMARALT
jgi:hypothetical protein